MRELSRTETQAVNGGADPVSAGLGLILSPFMALLLQQQFKASGFPVPSYFDALGMYLKGLFSN